MPLVPEPIQIVTGLVSLTRLGALGVAAIEELFPLYGRFLERFQREVNKWDISLSEDVDEYCYRSAEFRRVAIRYLILPAQHATDFRAYLSENFSPLQVDELFRIAERVAAGFEKDPRLVTVQSRQELRNQIDAKTEEIARGLEGITTVLDGLVRTGTERHAEAKASNEEILIEIRGLSSKFRDSFASVERDLLSGSGDESPASALNKLREVDAPAAAKVQALWDAGGIARFAKAARSAPQPPLPPAAWRTIGNILAEADLSPDAEAAFLQGTLATTSDRERTELYVGAARAADADDRPARADEHLALAREYGPSNPTLAVCEARRLPDRGERLERLRDVESGKAVVQAQIHQTRGEAHLVLRDFTSARQELELAQELAPDEPIVRELAGMIPWFEAVLAHQEGRQFDAAQVEEAAAIFEALGTHSRERGRVDESTQILSRTVQCLTMIGSAGRAIELAEELVEGPMLGPAATAAAGNAALLCGRPDLVLNLIREDAPDDHCRLVLANAKVLTGDQETRSTARSMLSNLLQSSDPDVATNAAITLLRESGGDPNVPWDSHAEGVLRPGHPFLVAILHAIHHLARDEFDEAERILLPYGDRADALKLLVDCALEREDWAKAADRWSAVVALTDDPSDRLNWARALSRSGHPDASREQALAVARRTSVPSDTRDGAFGLALAEMGYLDFVGLEELAVEWIDAVPQSAGARWNLAYARTRLGRVGEAYELVGSSSSEGLTLDQARLLAEIFQRSLSAAEAFPRLIELSEQFGRAEEVLEGAAVHSALLAGTGALTDDVARQYQETVARFLEQFPTSTMLQALPEPESGEALLAALRELEGDRPSLIRSADRAVNRGRAPAAYIAAAAGRGCLDTWGRLPWLPLGYLDAEADELDDATAETAIGGAVVWDTASLYVLSCLPNRVRDVIATAFPGSVVSTDVLGDAVAVDNSPDRATAVIGTNEDGTGWLYEPTAAEIAQRQDRVATAQAHAQALIPRVPKTTPRHSRWADLYFQHGHERRTALDTVVATMLVAEAERRPIYSDDRWVRQAARHEGLNAFGTLALLGVLQERELIDPSTHEFARRALAAERSWGVGLSGFEIRRAARECDFKVTDVVEGALRDHAAWLSPDGAIWPAVVGLLVEAHSCSVHAVGPLLKAANDGYRTAHLDDCLPTEALEIILAVSWVNAGSTVLVTQPCFYAMAVAAREYAAGLKPPATDPVLGAARRIVNQIDAADVAQRRKTIEHLARRGTPGSAQIIEQLLEQRPTPL